MQSFVVIACVLYVCYSLHVFIHKLLMHVFVHVLLNENLVGLGVNVKCEMPQLYVVCCTSVKVAIASQCEV